MDLEAKEIRLIVLGLKKLLHESMEKMKSLPEDNEDYVFLVNDAALIDTMIQGFSEQYKLKSGSNLS